MGDTLELKLYTQEFPPLQYRSEKGEVTGFVVETVREAVRDMKERMPVTISRLDILPWKRALMLAELEPNVLVFSLSRTPEREDKYYWIGTVAPYSLSFYKLSARDDIKAESPEDLKGQGHRIGSQIGSSLEEYLVNQGFGENGDSSLIDGITENQRNIARLYRGFVDLIMFSDYSLKHRACNQGLDPDKLEKVVSVPELSSELWLIASRATAPEVVHQLRESLQEVKRSGRHKELMDRYFSQWAKTACR
ncbi:substrate-binding periplasmic protein [Hahella ganghwensis]|uniref:substrate-binding periplasmic protein n=1 Tax=Hahella ganghwensis TaxID=286420 RepID=UPI00036D538C|nr:transporter substrate-binding domain-containing protein [Hahella ganghwensis]